MNDNCRIGILGTGRRMRSVVRRLMTAAEGRIQIQAVYDPDPLSLKEAGKDFGPQTEICTSESALLQHPEVDWVLIGTMNHQHANQAIAAMENGKHVFCEKPLAITFEDCLRVRKSVAETGQTFAFGLVLRYSPHYRKIHDLVTSGAIGEIISFEFNETLAFNHGGFIFGNWRRQRELAGTHLLEKCCHDLDLANWITGRRVLRAASFGGKNFFVPKQRHHAARIGEDSEGRMAYQTYPDPHRKDPFSLGSDIVDNQVAILQYEGGVRATFHTNCNSGLPERRFYLCGTEGTIRADVFTGVIELARIGHDSKVETFTTSTSNSHGGGDAVMAQALTDTILHGAAPLATVEDGLQACVAAFGIDAALDSGQVVDLQPYWDSVDGSIFTETPTNTSALLAHS